MVDDKINLRAACRCLFDISRPNDNFSVLNSHTTTWHSVNIIVIIMRCLVGLLFLVSFVPGNYAKNLTVSIYYEALCPDSVNFLVNQFDRAYATLKENLTVELVPFGKATAKRSNGTWTFTCQHGASECYGNMVHACAIGLAPVERSIEFVVCAMQSGNASHDAFLEQCAIDSEIDWSKLRRCATSGQGGDFLAANGNLTAAVKPNITFIPTVVFDHQYKEALQNIALKNFFEIADFLIHESDCERCKSSGAPSAVSSVLLLFSASVWLVGRF